MITCDGMTPPEMVEALGPSKLPAKQARMMPRFTYTSEEFFEKVEKPAVFERQWLCVGREAWIPEKGDYFTTSYIDEPLLVVRTRSGDVKVMSNVCRHRGLIIAEGSGNNKFFRCPYHHWLYTLDGELAGAPTMDESEGFDRRDIALPSMKMEIWNGFIFMNFDADAPALKPQLARFDEDFDNYELADAIEPEHDRRLDYPWNWKVLFENTNDGLHANRLHAGPMHDFCPSHLASWQPYKDDDIGVVRYTGFTIEDGSFNPTMKALLPVFPKLTKKERNRMVFINIPPTFWIACLADQIVYFLIHPEGANKCWMDYGILYSAPAAKDPLLEEKVAIYLQSFSEIAGQDRHANTLQQRGMRSKFFVPGRTSYQEESAVRFGWWAIKQYEWLLNQQDPVAADKVTPIKRKAKRALATA